MLAVQLTTNVFLLAAGGVFCILFGLMYRQGQIQKHIKHVIELEKEMLRNHAEIIDLHRQIDFFKNQGLKTGATILKLQDASISDEHAFLQDVIHPGKKLLRRTSNLK
jgi:hypothetical protein